jgi:hypothetical protein
VLLHLTATVLANGSTSMKASSTEIAKATRSERSAIVRALNSLRERGLIATRKNARNEGAAHMLRFLDVQQIGGVFKTPPAPPGGVTATPQVVLFEHHSGVPTTPPATETQALAPPPSVLDINPDSIRTIDRALLAQPKTFERGELGEVRRLIVHAVSKIGRPYEQDPDAAVCAQIFEACGRSLQALQWLVVEMHRVKQTPGESPSWWVTVALQRLQNVPAKATAARRAELKAAKRPRLVKPAIAPAPTAEVDEIKHQVAALAAGKRF